MCVACDLKNKKNRKNFSLSYKKGNNQVKEKTLNFKCKFRF